MHPAASAWRGRTRLNGVSDDDAPAPAISGEARVIERPADLPDFRHPPISEVAIALTFEPLTNMRQAHLGSYWTLIRKDFPQVDDRPPVDNQIEELGVTTPPAFELRLVEAPSVSRGWFLSEDGTRLIQLQPDRFVHNWRGEGDKYPRFNAIAASFIERLEEFSSWAEDERLGGLVATQLEVTYVNRLGPERLASYLVPLDDVTLSGGGLRPNAIDAVYSTRFDVADETNQPVGRLYVDARPVSDPADDRRSVTNTLTISFRAPNGSVEAQELVGLLGRGRNAIVTAFTALTRPDHHTRWERIR